MVVVVVVIVVMPVVVVVVVVEVVFYPSLSSLPPASCCAVLNVHSVYTLAAKAGRRGGGRVRIHAWDGHTENESAQHF